MWKNAPGWLIIIRDIISFVAGIGGIAFLTLQNSSNTVLALVFMLMTGLPGIDAVITLIRGGQTSQPPTNTDGSQSSQPVSRS